MRGFKSSSGNDIYNLTTPTTQKKMSVVSDRSSTSSTSNSTMETETESKHLSWDSGHNEEMSTTWYPDDDHNNIGKEIRFLHEKKGKDSPSFDLSFNLLDDLPDDLLLFHDLLHFPFFFF